MNEYNTSAPFFSIMSEREREKKKYGGHPPKIFH